MLKALLFSAPYVAFFVYAIRVCRQNLKVAKQPATLALYVCYAMLLQLTLVLLINLLLAGGGISYLSLYRTLAPILRLIRYTCLAGIVVCIFAWRPVTWADLKLPAILTGFIVVLRALTYNIEVRPHSEWVSVLFIILNLTGDMLTLKAIFVGRRHAEEAPGSLPNSSSPDVSAPAPTPALPAKGTFKEDDYVPYILGIMVLGGLVAIPLVYGGITDISYGRALLPSLISCGIFAYSHDKRGTFLMGRFIMLYLFSYITLLRASLQYGGNGQQTFVAGGLIGILVMTGCGWAGVMVGRYWRGKTKAAEPV